MIVVGTTLAAFVMDQEDTWAAWLRNAEVIKESHPAGVHYFAAIQVDIRGLSPFWPLIDRLSELGGSYWTFSLDDGRTVIKEFSRIRHANLGRNLVADYAIHGTEYRHGGGGNCSHLLFLSTDCEPPPDILPKLLEVNHPVVVPFISTYLEHSFGHGPEVPGYPFPVRDTMASTSVLFLDRRALKGIRARFDSDEWLGDDRCFHHDAQAIGIPTYMRMDCVVRHYPERVNVAGGVEVRGHQDLRVYR